MPGKMARSDPRPAFGLPHLAPALQEGRQNANIDAGLGFIWRISVYELAICFNHLSIPRQPTMETIPNDDGRRFMLNRACASADISLVRMTVSALIAVSFASCALATDYCSNIQNLPSLVDLGPGQTYQGYEGGLYPGASNVRPAAHDAAGRRIAQSIVPLDANGNPDPVNGKIVYTIMSVSNGYPMWHNGDAGVYGADTSVTFMTRANADPAKNPKLFIAYGFEYQVGGSNDMGDPNSAFFPSMDVAFQEQGITPQQAQVIFLFTWLSVDTGTPLTGENLSFPNDAHFTENRVKNAVLLAKAHFPNLKIIYVSTKGYTYAPPNPNGGGIAVPGGPIEPWNHDAGWSAKWMIEDQINGDPSLNYDPARGAVTAPWLSWGPYFWTYGDGTPRAYDGFSWNCGDVYDDGIHLNHSGMYKEVSLLLAQMTSDPTATPWFLGNGEVPPPVVEEPPRPR
jgi:hypothetical protein